MAAILTRDKKAVMGNFEFQGQPMWAIYEGNKPLACCCDDDDDVRRDTLQKYLDFIEEGGSTGNFEIRYYDEAGKNNKVTNTTPYFGSLPFKINSSDKQLEFIATAKNTATGGGNQDLMMKLFDAKMETLSLRYETMLQKKDEEIQALENALAEEPEDDGPAYEQEGLGKLGAITDMIGAAGEKYPWLQDTIKTAVSTLTNLVNGAKTKFSAMTEQPVQMNGVPPKPDDMENLDNKLKWSQQTLIRTYRQRAGVAMDDDGNVLDKPGNQALLIKADTQYVNDMVKLAEVASTKPKTFENAIGALREL